MIFGTFPREFSISTIDLNDSHVRILLDLIVVFFSCPGGSSPRLACDPGTYNNQVGSSADTDCQVAYKVFLGLLEYEMFF